ncbi:MAG: VIT domain-containing protein [Fimbriiglobus sp.]
MTPQDDDRDDRLGDLIRQAMPTGVEPNPEFLASLRDASIRAFTDAPATSPQTQTSTKRTPPMTQLLRIGASFLALSLVGFLIYMGVREIPGPTPDVRFVTLEDGLYFTLTENGETTHIYTRLPGFLRLERAPGRYVLVQGGESYQVDEEANRFSRGTSRFFSQDRPEELNVLALAGITEDETSFISTDAETSAFRLNDGSEVEIRRENGKFRELRRFILANNARVLLTTLTLQDPKPMPDDKFALAKTLSEDGRVGKVSEVQGLASVKPKNASRFTPLRPGMLLMPGDWVQVDLRGANAATLKLLPQATIIAGPGAMLEIVKPNAIKLLAGEAEITPDKETPIAVDGPDNKKLPDAVKERGFYRIINDKITRATTDPVWLKSLKGTSVNESLGSLVAQVDGRSVNLTVGIHKVNVEVRDQIARTTIEETFVNNTNQTLEGTFYFPLPQDASIAGFGMWIGNELVEADVVEKQRAREIFEIILREKRDPGLLEWNGGNIFKARVFPIFPHSDKRVKITYTQVLPAVGKKIRYSYALQSEMLRLNPLKELSVDFTVTSANPIKSVTSPTHTVRTSKSDTSAKLEFTAQEYTPTKDFEAVIEMADNTAPVTLIPHRRGEDGYFLVQVSPPAREQAERDILGETAPLATIFWCDTSTSIDPGQRKTQDAIVAAMLTALTPQDQFNLVCSDVNTDAAFEKPVPATKENIAKARDFLAKRISLGWSDLTLNFGRVLAMAPANAHVIYLGDGVANTITADPAGAAKSLEDQYRLSMKSVTFHAVALGSSFESGVMAKLGSFGGGSSRRVNAEQGPVAIALEILGEITRPPVRNVKVTFPGLQTAKVYPEILPNLVPGAQQILLGRYLPKGENQKGEVVVTGEQGGKEIQYRATVSLKDAEAGNSFLPRLWARMHLDKLLLEPQTPNTKETIIGLSEEFHIMTPYTSFLVLESDADRERFKVKRRFQMRDGEAFFTEGQDKARYELTRDQMKAAGLWRAGLQRQVLESLKSLGRTPPNFDVTQLGQRFELREAASRHMYFAEGKANFNGRYDYNSPIMPTSAMPAMAPRSAPRGASGPGGLGGGMPGEPGGFDDFDGTKLSLLDGKPGSFKDMKEMSAERKSDEDLTNPDAGIDPEIASAVEAQNALSENANGIFSVHANVNSGGGGFGGGFGGGLPGVRQMMKQEMHPRELSKVTLQMQMGDSYWNYQRAEPSYLEAYFPSLSSVPKPFVRTTKLWSAEALALAEKVHRQPKLSKLPGAVRREIRVEQFQEETGHPVNVLTRSELYHPSRWLVREGADVDRTTITTADGKLVRCVATAHELARERKAEPLDLERPELSDFDMSMNPLWSGHGYLSAKVEKEGEFQVIVLNDATKNFEQRITIDPVKNVIVKSTNKYAQAEEARTTEFSDFVEIQGQWWATKITVKLRGLTLFNATLKVTGSDLAEHTKACDEILAGTDKFLTLVSPYRKVAQAKAALAAGKATAQDHWTLLRRALAYQQWTEAKKEFEILQKLEADKKGWTWVEEQFLLSTRRNEEARKLHLEHAAKSQRWPNLGDRIWAANRMVQYGRSILSTEELHELITKLTPAFMELPKDHLTRWSWVMEIHQSLVNMGRTDEAREYLKKLTTEYPKNANLRVMYARDLFNSGFHKEAYEYIKALIAAKDAWPKNEREQFYSVVSDWYENEVRLEEKAKFLQSWLDDMPDNEGAAWQLLSALVRIDKGEEAEKRIQQWIDAGTVAKPTDAQIAQLRAALRHIGGSAHNFQIDRLDPKWFPVLADLATKFYDHPKHEDIARIILTNRFLVGTELHSKTLKALFTKFVEEAPKLSYERVMSRVEFWDALLNQSEDYKAGWAKVIDHLEKRWAGTTNEVEKHALGVRLAALINHRLGYDPALRFVREMIKSGPKDQVNQYRLQLFSMLDLYALKDGHTNELYELIPTFLIETDKKWNLEFVIAKFMQLNDATLQRRDAQLQGELTNPEKLTRPELKTKREELSRQARGELIARLKKLEDNYPELLRQWVKLDRLDFETRHETKDFSAITAEILKTLGDKPLSLPDPDDEEAMVKLELLPLYAQDRLVSLAMYTVTRRTAKPEEAAKLLKFFEVGQDSPHSAAHWKMLQYRLLVAKDMPKELEAKLKAWVKESDPEAQWRTALANVLAEMGKLNEAIATLESVKEIDAAAYSRLQSLARWYMALDQKEKHLAAKAAAYKQLDEGTLYNMLVQKLGYWQRAPKTELEPETLLILEALVDKALDVSPYFESVKQLYEATKDHRIPASVSNAMIGQSAGKVYNVITNMNRLMETIREEATVDLIQQRLDELKAKKKTPVDERALDLLAMQVFRRASQVLNQPGPQIQKALAAFRKAYDHPWAEGERRLYAYMLSSLGKIDSKELAEEQMRQMKALVESLKPGDQDHLEVSNLYAQMLWDREDFVTSITTLTKALDAYIASHKNQFNINLMSYANILTDRHERLAKYADAEKLWLKWIDQADNANTKQQLVFAMQWTCLRAYHAKAEVSLGQGTVLYQALQTRLLAELKAGGSNRIALAMQQLDSLYRYAHERKEPTAKADVRKLAFELFSEFVPHYLPNYAYYVNQVGNLVKDVGGPDPIEALRFVLDRTETDPKWFRNSDRDGWRQYYGLSRYRVEAGNKLPQDLEARLLKIVLRELRDDLTSKRGRSDHTYFQRHDQLYWSQKEPEFAALAEQVLKEKKESLQTVMYITNYMFYGCNRQGRAIELLWELERAKKLDFNQRLVLVTYLQVMNRNAEVIDLLISMINEQPKNRDVRFRLMGAYSVTGKKAELKELYTKTLALWKAEKLLDDGMKVVFAYFGQDHGLHAEAVELFSEAIPNIQRATQGTNHGLADNYRRYAISLSALGRSIEAVDAASGAIVCWGPQKEYRAQALQTLLDMIVQAINLDDIAKHLDKETEKTGLINPIVRKALGQGYSSRQLYAKAITQFELAIEAQPNDPETFNGLIEAYDKQNLKKEAIDRILKALDLNRRDAARFQDLGKRYEALENKVDAERAYTSIVEALPNEAEGHAILAAVRKSQKRYAESVKHWEQVNAIRSLEPTGLLGLADVQIEMGETEGAKKTIQTLRAKFPAVKQQIDALEKRVK